MSSNSRSSTLLGLDLRCSSSSSPRAVSSWTVCSSTSNNRNQPHDGRSSTTVTARNVNISTNPFDDAASMDHRQSSSSSWGRVAYGGATGEEITDAADDTKKNLHHVLAFGTDQGSIHCRIYPDVKNDADAEGNSTSSRIRTSSNSTSGTANSSPIKPCDDSILINGGSSLSAADYNNAFQGSVVSMTRLTLASSGNETLQQHQQETNPLFVVLIDDHKGAGPQSSTTTSGAYASYLVTLQRGAFQKIATGVQMPRMSCCAYDINSGFVYAAGTSVLSLPESLNAHIANALISSSSVGGGGGTSHGMTSSSSSFVFRPLLRFNATNVLPGPVRTNPLSLALTCNGSLAVIGVNHSFYAIRAGSGTVCSKIVSFAQGQVHPAVVLPILSTGGTTGQNHSSGRSLLFVGSARECTTCVIDVSSSSTASSNKNVSGGGGSSSSNSIIRVFPGSKAHQLLRRGRGSGYYHSATPSLSSSIFSSSGQKDDPDITTLTSPILSAAPIVTRTSSSKSGFKSQQTYYVAILTSDGLVQLRHPSCLAVPFRTVEVGSRPNNFYYLGTLGGGGFNSSASTGSTTGRADRLLSVGYSGDARVIMIKQDTPQDQADRLMKLAIDAFGTNGFPRADLADVLGASYSATSYVGSGGESSPASSSKAKQLFLQYLEAMLHFDEHHEDHGSGGQIGGDGCGDDDNDDHQLLLLPPPLITGSSSSVGEHNEDHQYHQHLVLYALLCLAASGLSPPAASLANRAAKRANAQIVSMRDHASAADGVSSSSPKNIQNLISSVADSLLEQSSALLSSYRGHQDISLLPGSTTSMLAPNTMSSLRKQPKEESATELIEASMWLLRSAGLHRKALRVLRDKMEPTTTKTTRSAAGGSSSGGGWSLIQYESYAASHLAELWATNNVENAQLVLSASTTRQLLESNPELGLSVFVSHHPISRKEWSAIDQGKGNVRELDPIHHCIDVRQVVGFLKSMQLSSTTSAIGGIESSVHMEEEGLEIEYRTTLMVAGTGSSVSSTGMDRKALPLVSGRDLAIKFIESVIGISTGRSPFAEEDAFSELPLDPEIQEKIVSLHEELYYLLLEGTLMERKGGHSKEGGDNDDHDETHRGKKYRSLLRRLLVWPRFQGRSEQLLEALPSSSSNKRQKTFLFEHAILLGRLGRHDDALRIMYHDMGSLDLALRYCDGRFEHERRRRSSSSAALKNKVQTQEEAGSNSRRIGRGSDGDDCVYLPLVRVALEGGGGGSNENDSFNLSVRNKDKTNAAEAETKEQRNRDIGAAIQILTLRSHVIDRVAALRLLPSNIQVSALARPFLIPALAESESRRRRYKLAASVLRARYVGLKRALTDAEIASQASWRSVPALRALIQLGNKTEQDAFVRTSKPTILRPASQPVVAPYFPNVTLIKHYFSNHLFLQAKISNDLPDFRTLGDVAFVVAESSSEGAVMPAVNVPLKVLPARNVGSAWCALTVVPARFEGAVLLTCELRYTIMAVDLATGAPLSFSGEGGGGGGRTYVEELNDIEIRPKEFRFV